MATNEAPPGINDAAFVLPQRHHLSLGQKVWGVLVGGFVAILIILGAIRSFHRGRLLPGTSAYGIYLGGVTRTEAVTLLEKETTTYKRDARILMNTKGAPTVTLLASQLHLEYNPTTAVDQLYTVGRQGNVLEQIRDDLGLLIGATPLPTEPVSYDATPVYAALGPTFAALNKPVVNAGLGLNKQGTVIVTADQTGTRLNLARLATDLTSILRGLDRTTITAQSYAVPALVTTDSLNNQADQVAQLSNAPLTLTDGGRSWTISRSEVLSWYGAPVDAHSLEPRNLMAYYPPLPSRALGLAPDPSRIATSLQTIAKQLYQPAVDAKLTYSGNRASVFQQSQDGRAVDVAASVTAIVESLTTPATNAQSIALVVRVTKAAVNDENIDDLGIHDLLAEGVTYFPGSSSNRLTNVRIGQALYNNYLLKPDQIFSFGEILGPVGPEQGYTPGLVILADHEEKAYGGGLCQVSSTAFRAALLAGLPIVERVNHAFAVSFYTAPFGVPGVDATIYYSQVDFKFKNDTGHYLLIQTEMVGTTLKFRYYGTKKKEGVLRGPTFIYGSNDPNQPSQTVFYRDVVVDGKVIKTDTFKTTYKSALDFPVSD